MLRPLPARLTIIDGAVAADGGTISLQATDEAGNRHHVVLAQHRRPKATRGRWRPGRLYLDDELIDLRSETEARIVTALRAAMGGPDGRFDAMLASVVKFVDSAEYVAFAG